MTNSPHTTTQATNAPLVMQARGLVKRYGQVTALDGADFELRAGEILAVIGDNGAGHHQRDDGAAAAAGAHLARLPCA